MTEQSQVDHNIGPESYIGAGELTSQSQGAHEYWDRPIVDEELSFIWMRTCVHALLGQFGQVSGVEKLYILLELSVIFGSDGIITADVWTLNRL